MRKVNHVFGKMYKKVKPTLILVNSVLYVAKKVFLLM